MSNALSKAGAHTMTLGGGGIPRPFLVLGVPAHYRYVTFKVPKIGSKSSCHWIEGVWGGAWPPTPGAEAVFCSFPSKYVHFHQRNCSKTSSFKHFGRFGSFRRPILGTLVTFAPPRPRRVVNRDSTARTPCGPEGGS